VGGDIEASENYLQLVGRPSAKRKLVPGTAVFGLDERRAAGHPQIRAVRCESFHRPEMRLHSATCSTLTRTLQREANNMCKIIMTKI